MSSGGDAAVEPKLRESNICHNEEESWLVSAGEQVQVAVIKEEEAVTDRFYVQCQPPTSNQGKTLPFLWVGGIGILDMAIYAHVKNIHLFRTSSSPHI